MSCGLLPLCYDAMALGQVPFIDVEGDQQQLVDAIGSASKVSRLHNCTVCLLHRLTHADCL